MKKVLTILILLTTLSLSASILEESQEACELGNPGACYYLGNAYSKTTTIHKDFLKAKQFYSRACNGGHVESCYVLGTIYEYAYKTEQNYAEAENF